MRTAHHSWDSPTELARDFNIRFDGRPITVHAARKWLLGEAIPTQDKIRTLSEWLHVSVEWLRFGEDANTRTAMVTGAQFNPSELKLISDLNLLGEDHQTMVREFIRILLHTKLSPHDTEKRTDSEISAQGEHADVARHNIELNNIDLPNIATDIHMQTAAEQSITI